LKSLPAEKENSLLLCSYLKDICLWTLDNPRLLGLVSPVSDVYLVSYREACHKTLPGAGDLLLISHPGSSQDGPHTNAKAP
jgi:hypothetical protein